MKSKDQVEKELRVLQWRINRLYESLDSYADCRDIRKVKHCADEIAMCDESIKCLQWVLGDE